MDFRDFKPGFPGETKDAGREPGFWWQEKDDDERARCLLAAAKHLKQDQEFRSQLNLRHARLYGNFESLGFDPREYAKETRPGKITLNVVKAAINTGAAKIAKNKSRPSFLTDGAGWKLQQKVRRLDRFVRGLFYETKFHRKARIQFLHAWVFGTGVLKFFMGPGGRLVVENVFPDEIYVDDADGLYGEPRQVLQRKLIPREVLLAEYPKAKVAIAVAKGPDGNTAVRGFGDLIEVWEAWHLPSGKGAGDGKHSIAMEGAELFTEEWELESFPFSFYMYEHPLRGFWGRGAAEALTGIQLELNRLMRSVSEQLRRKGRGRIFVQKGSGVVASHITNAIADIVHYTGAAPIVDNSNAVAPEEFMQIDRLYQKAFQEVGLSEMSASGKKPSGLDAAVALREFSDIESERFSLAHQEWDECVMDSTERMLEQIRRHSGGSYKVRIPNRRFVEFMDWKDIALAADAYTMQMFPVSSLPGTPAARKQAVKELLADGFIDQATAKRLLDFPDIDAENDLGNAALDDVDATISLILDEDQPKLMQPDKYSNLELLQQRALASYLFAKHHGCDARRLDMLRMLIDSAAGMVMKAMAGAPAPGAPPPGAPPMPAGPMGPPAPAISGGINMNVEAPGPAPLAPPVIQ